jgi:dCMP deaminase
MTRIAREDWALGIAEAVSRLGDCSRRQVGAVLFDSRWRVLSVGYNGAEPGGPSCLAGQCPRATSGVAPDSSYDTGPGACIALHAEQNAVLYADPLKRRGGILVVSAEPCEGCAKLIRGSEIARVITPLWRLG